MGVALATVDGLEGDSNLANMQQVTCHITWRTSPDTSTSYAISTKGMTHSHALLLPLVPPHCQHMSTTMTTMPMPEGAAKVCK
jgi:hypothetical protein